MKKAFTLIELLIVICIISLLAAILFPVFQRVRERARQSSCQSNLRNIGMAAVQYSQDWDEAYPFAYSQNMAADWKKAIEAYTKSSNGMIYTCPSNTTRKTNPSYTANSVNGYTYGSSISQRNGIMGFQDAWGIMPPAKQADITDPSRLIMIVETNWNNANLQPANAYYNSTNGPNGPLKSIALFSGHFGMANYCFADGHVKALRPFQTVTVSENGLSSVNMWRRDGKPYTNFGTYDQELAQSQKFLRYAEDYYGD